MMVTFEQIKTVSDKIANIFHPSKSSSLAHMPMVTRRLTQMLICWL